MKRFLLTALLLFLVAGICFAQQGTWRLPRVIAWDLDISCSYPRLAVNGNDMYLVYCGAREDVTEGPLMLIKSSNAGITWSAPQRIGGSNVVTQNQAYSILYEGGYLHVTFRGIYSSNGGLWVATSNDGGSSWQFTDLFC